MILELLKLSSEVQIALASGYTAYLIAYVGLRAPHRTIDVAFISLVFSLAATAISWTTASLGPIFSGAIAFCGSMIAGAIWRRWGRPCVRWILRRLRVAWSDDDPSALTTLSSGTKYFVTQIAVLTDDGTWYRCDDTAQFSDAPFGPCLIGPNGDVALYLTHEEKAGKKARKLKTVRHTHYGDRITYLPANRIRTIAVRHKKRR
ncbi:MAG TPA: hypothetical protein VFA65_20435 [Bryobacteraceae bacterium]|nr:hypothetical protein [Bryobacteraceae bacterium]